MRITLLLGGLLAALPSNAAILIADPTMLAGNYSGPYDYGGTPEFTTGASNTATSRNYQITYIGGPSPNPSFTLGDIHSAISWDPVTQGPITSIAMRMDIALTGTPGLGSWIHFNGPMPLTSGTQTASWTTNIISGPPVQFGFLFTGTRPASGNTLQISASNFCVAINEPISGCGPALAAAASLPEPNSLALLGSATLALTLYRRHRRKPRP